MTTVPVADLHSLNPGAIIELFEVDASNIPGGGVYRFHAGTNALRQPITWQGEVYSPYPVEVEGFSISTDGKQSRPTLKIANVNGYMGALVRDLEDLVGAVFTRKRTLAKYLDAVNYGGANPTAANVAWPDEVFTIEQKKHEDRDWLVFEMSSPLDLDGLLLPARQIVANLCRWGYRSTECGYSGGAVAKKDDTATAILAEDDCGKKVSSCKLRNWPDNVLPFGGFPGAGLIRA